MAKLTFRKKLLFSILPSALLVGTLAAGIWIGHSLANKSYRRYFEEELRAQTLGSILEDDVKSGVSRVYSDSAQALGNFDGYSWSVPNVPTPFLGTGPRPGVSGNAEINSLQFRSRLELSVPRASGVYRIFLTGGSTAYGAGAPGQHRTIGAYLENLLNKHHSQSNSRRFEVFTLANPSWASTHERILIENRLSEWEPDLVISLSGINDVHWGIQGRNILWFRTYQEEALWKLINAVYRTFQEVPLVDIVQVLEEPVSPPLVADRLEKNVRLASVALSMKRVPYIFALQPTLYVTGKHLSKREFEFLDSEKQGYYSSCYDLFKERLMNEQQTNFYFVDLSGVFDDFDEGREIFLDHYHFGDSGNLFLAEALIQKLGRILEKTTSN